jgi:hypothetical protein
MPRGLRQLQGTPAVQYSLVAALVTGMRMDSPNTLLRTVEGTLVQPQYDSN